MFTARAHAPVGVARLAGRLLGDRVLEDLPAVDLLLDAAARDETVDDDVLLLADAEGAVDGLRVGRRVPARIVYTGDDTAQSAYSRVKSWRVCLITDLLENTT